MTKWSLTTAVLLLSFTWVVAQSSSAPPKDNPQYNQPSTSQQPDTSQGKQPAAADRAAKTIEGCVQSVAGGFTLTDNSGKTYQLAGDTSKLADQAGHWDQVTGTEESGAAAAGGAPTFTVTKVKMVKTTCPTK